MIYQQKDLKTQWDLWALQLSGDKQATPILRGESNAGTSHYSATADGQRFLVNTVVSRGTPTMTVVLNWTAAMKGR